MTISAALETFARHANRSLPIKGNLVPDRSTAYHSGGKIDSSNFLLKRFLTEIGADGGRVPQKTSSANARAGVLHS
jgi:hypothetical protein